MDRTVALRAAGAFLLPGLVAGAFGAGPPFAAAALIIAATLGVAMMAFGPAPQRRFVPARARSRRRNRLAR